MKTPAFEWTIQTPGSMVLLMAIAAILLPLPSQAASVATTAGILRGETTRISVRSDGSQVHPEDGFTLPYSVSISADGRYVAFDSDAHDMVPGDTNGVRDVFVRDRVTNQTRRVSVSSEGSQGKPAGGPFNYGSVRGDISADGRYVAFVSDTAHLAPGDTNNDPDVFVHDLKTGRTELVSVASDGSQGSGDGPRISADGRFVAFYSYSSNLLAGDSNDQPDVFVHDRHTGQTQCVSVASNGKLGNSASWLDDISPDGRYVVFSSLATNLVPGDTNETYDVFVHDRYTGQTRRVSVASGGTQGDEESYTGSISADGRYVAFGSRASNFVAGDDPYEDSRDIFVHDTWTGKTSIVSVDSNGKKGRGGSGSTGPSISADGRYVVFQSSTLNLVSDDTNYQEDIFIHDRKTARTSRVNLGPKGSEANLSSYTTAISGDGRFVTFSSFADNLVRGDTNQAGDVFLRDRLLTPDKSADLNVWQSVSHSPVVKGQAFEYPLTVANYGQDAATGLTLTFVASSNDAVLRATVARGRGHCSKGPITVCHLDTLDPGHTTKVVMTLKPRRKGVYPNAVSVNAAPRDLVPKNNTRTKWVRVN